MKSRQPSADRQHQSQISAGQQESTQSRELTEIESEVRKTHFESREVKISDAGRHEKKVVRTQNSESKNESSEMFEAIPTQNVSSNDSLRRDDQSPPTDRRSEDWHQDLPNQVKVSIDGVLGVDGNDDAASLEGDYILDLCQQNSGRCRWTLQMPPCCGLNHVSLVATQNREGRFSLRLSMSGSCAGPVWRGQVSRIDSRLLTFDRQDADIVCAGCRWPATVLLTALGTDSGDRSPSDIDLAEMAQKIQLASGFGNASVNAAGSSSGGSSSSCGGRPCPDPEPPCETGGGGGGGGGGCTGDSCTPPPQASNFPVRYFNGEVELSVSDLSASGFGSSWGHRRIYSNQMSRNHDYGNGYNWLVNQWGYLNESAGGTITVVRGRGSNLWFDLDGVGGYVGRYGTLSTLTHDVAGGVYVLRNASGEEYAFHDFDQFLFPPGTFAWHRTAGGQITQVTSYTDQDRIGEIQRSLDHEGETITESFRYDYFTSGAQDGRLNHVTLRRKIDNGAWQDIQRAEYEYYGSKEKHGSLGDLKRVSKQEPSSGSSWQDTDAHYYRYWKDGDAKGFAHGLKYVVEPESYARISEVTDPLLASDSQIAQYADYYYEYNASRRVAKETVQAGAMSFTFKYSSNSGANNHNHWRRKTVETRPDGSQNIVYTNHIGQVLVKRASAPARIAGSKRCGITAMVVRSSTPSPRQSPVTMTR